jgi:hypothetical protein
VFARLYQSQLSLQTRFNWLISPLMSLQLHMQPLVAVGRYETYKEFAQRNTFDFWEYGSDRGTIAYDAESDSYTVEPDPARGAPAFTFDNPDFNSKSLRAQCVFRWEFRQGSRLYVVWTQQRRDQGDPPEINVARDLPGILAARPDNVVAVKLTYWIGR